MNISQTLPRTIVLFCFVISPFVLAISHSDTMLRKRVSGLSMSELMNKGKAYYRDNEIDSAMFMFTVVADKYDNRMSRTDKEFCANAFNNVGVIDAFYRLDYVSAYNNMAHSLDIAVDNGLIKVEGVVCLNIAELFTYFYRHFKTDVALEKIKEYSIRGFRKAYEAKDYPRMGAVVINSVTFDLGVDTKPYSDLFNSDVPDDERNVAYARSLIHVSELFKAGKYEQTRQALKDALPLMDSAWIPERYAESMYVNIADTYIAENKPLDAEKWLLKALEKADSLGYVNQLTNVLSALATLDVPRAGDYKIRYLEKMNSVMLSGRMQMISEMDFIRVLGKEHKRADELLENRRQLLLWLGVGGCVLLVVIVVAIIVIRLNRKLAERNRALYKLIRPSLAPCGAVAGEGGRDSSDTAADKYSGQSLNDERIEEIYLKVEEYMRDEQKVCEADFSLSKLSAAVGVNTTYVSRVINERYGRSFSAFVGERRIRIACRRMDDPANYGNLTIEAIARSVGFASRSTFVSMFKKTTQMTPSEYLKAARELNGGIG